ncbi:MAG: N-acetylmuramoyl-L-alanine amidase [Lachnospiraceae bacterium]|nr:N-acetylmuramoyl-L-alanine amidase [Lachnospiraceae bacterium]
MKEIRRIVIDPGHGGENLGTISNENFVEKDITFLTAQTIYDELSKYDELEIYMTRTEDVDLSLKERAAFAEEVDADMVFSIHYNASESHLMFGSEIWVPLDAPGNATGYRFGEIFLSKMQDMGLHLRGIKTRESEETPGNNYYGIIRESHERGIPAVILEHCYVDAPDDISYVEGEESIIAFGKADAQAILEFVGLEPHSKEYESYTYPIDQVVPSTLKDNTPPEYCEIEVMDADYDNGLLSLQVTAVDSESTLLYYDYSLDGGETYSAIMAWPESNALTGSYADSFKLTIAVEHRTIPKVSVRAYNGFDLTSESNTISDFDGVFLDPVELLKEQQVEDSEEVGSEEESPLESYETVSLVKEEQKQEFTKAEVFVLLSLFVVLFIFFASILMMLLERRHKRKRRRKK